MKKLIFIAVASLLGATAIAQQGKEATAVLKKIERSDASIADAKKAASAGTWIERANILTDAATVYTTAANLVANIPAQQLTTSLMAGEPTKIEEVQIADESYSKYVYENFDVYVSADGMVSFWDSRKEVYPNAFFKSLESLKKAKELSAKDFGKGGRGTQAVEKLSIEMTSAARNSYILRSYESAGKLFSAIGEVKALTGVVDTSSIYYAGVCYSEGGLQEKALPIFEHLLSIGALEDGMTYAYIGTALDKLGRADEAISTLEGGFAKYPQNTAILTGLINIYMAKDKNPDKLIELIQKAQAVDAKNVSLYMVESQIWDKIGQRDKAFAAIKKALEIDPNNFGAHFNYAILNILESDVILEQANKLDINDTKTYDALMAKHSALLKDAIEVLEKAHKLDAKSSNVVDLLRQLYFQRRDESPEMKARYDYFDNLSKEQKGE